MTILISNSMDESTILGEIALPIALGSIHVIMYLIVRLFQTILTKPVRGDRANFVLKSHRLTCTGSLENCTGSTFKLHGSDHLGLVR